MARQKKDLADVFSRVSGNEQENVTQSNTTETVEEVVTQDAPVTSPEAITEVVEEVEVDISTTVKDIANRLQQKYQEKVSKPTVEDTHIRTTFLFRKDLAKRLDKLSKNKRGYKTQFLNEAIEALLNEIE